MKACHGVPQGVPDIDIWRTRAYRTVKLGGRGFVGTACIARRLEAQPATVDATMINNVPRIIQADFLSGDIRTPILRVGVLRNN